MTLIFSAICEHAIRTALGRYSRNDDWVVYGDDVIIRKEAVAVFEDSCRKLGLKVNTDKSYSDPATPHYYRESCGIEAADGVDCTPIRYSRFQDPIVARAPVDVKYWASVFTLMNRCFTENAWYENMRSVVVECIKRSIQRGEARKQAIARTIWDNALRIDYSDYAAGFDGPLAVVVPDGTATNYRSQSGYDADYQRKYIRVRAPRVEPVDVRKRIEDDAANGDLSTLEAALHLWSFKAADRELTEADKFDYLDEDVEVRESLLRSVAGVQALRWVWIRYYP
jgi:hypothetical protein